MRMLEKCRNNNNNNNSDNPLTSRRTDEGKKWDATNLQTLDRKEMRQSTQAI